MALKNFEQLYSLSGDLILPKVQVIDQLGSTDNTKPLAASQGKVIKLWIDEYNNNKGEGGYAQLDANGMVPASLLPSYVDDVLEFGRRVSSANVISGSSSLTGNVVYNDSTNKFIFKDSSGKFYSNWGSIDDSNNTPPATSYGTLTDAGVVPAKNKIYVCIGIPGDTVLNPDNNSTFRYSGSTLIEISKSLILGEGAGTAYEGNKGKTTTIKLNNLLATVRLFGPINPVSDFSATSTNVTLDVDVLKPDTNGIENLDTATYTIPAATDTKAGVITAALNKAFNSLPSVFDTYDGMIHLHYDEPVGIYDWSSIDQTLSYIGQLYCIKWENGKFVRTTSKRGVAFPDIPVATATKGGILDPTMFSKLNGILTITEAELNAILV